MKSNLIKIVSVLMVLTMVFLGAVPAFAAEAEAEKCTLTFYFVDGTKATVEVDAGTALTADIIPEFDATLEDGRQFQGWYVKGEEVALGTIVTSDMSLFAKYFTAITVGDKVLNKKMLDVKNQNKAGEGENLISVRFVTSIDALDYKSVKFNVTFGSTTYTLETSNAYTALSGDTHTADQVFVADSQYFVAYTINNIPMDQYSEVTVQAVLVLLDGTEVAGNAQVIELALA